MKQRKWKVHSAVALSHQNAPTHPQTHSVHIITVISQSHSCTISAANDSNIFITKSISVESIFCILSQLQDEDLQTTIISMTETSKLIKTSSLNTHLWSAEMADINFKMFQQIIGSGTDPISLFNLLLLLLSWASSWATLFKKGYTNWIGVKFGRIVLQVNMLQLMELIFGTTSQFQHGSHVVHPPLIHMQQHLYLAGTCDVTGSLYEQQFLIHSTIVLVCTLSTIQVTMELPINGCVHNQQSVQIC